MMINDLFGQFTGTSAVQCRTSIYSVGLWFVIMYVSQHNLLDIFLLPKLSHLNIPRPKQIVFPLHLGAEPLK